MLILGGGGHSRVIIDCMQGTTLLESSVILDQDESLWGQDIQGVPILGGDDLIPELVKQGATQFVVGLGSTADNLPRQKLFDIACSYGLEPRTVRHPSAFCSPFAQIGKGTVMFPVSVVNAGAVLGNNVIVNTGALIEHDCMLGDHAHIASGGRLSGSENVGKAAHVGAGATIRQCLTIGEGSVVGIGAAVIKDVAPWTTVVGVPARELTASKIIVQPGDSIGPVL